MKEFLLDSQGKSYCELIYLWLSNIGKDVIIKAWSNTNILLVSILFIISNNECVGGTTSYALL